MELFIFPEKPLFYNSVKPALDHYRAVLIEHQWEQIGQCQVGIARRREVLFATDCKGEVCWIRKVR